jgi:hypothetical protein
VGENRGQRRGRFRIESPRRWARIEATDEVGSELSHRGGGRISSSPKRWPQIELTEEVDELTKFGHGVQNGQF